MDPLTVKLAKGESRWVNELDSTLNTAKDHAVLKSLIRTWVAREIASNNDGASWFNVANAHAVLERLCGLKSLIRTCAACAIASNNNGEAWFNVANAHAVLERSCGLKSTPEQFVK